KQRASGDKEPALKLTCQPHVLSHALQTVSRAISTRTTLPILNNLLLETTSEGLALTATNLEIGIRKVIPAEVAEEGSTTAPARLLTEFVGTLPEQPLEMALDTGTQKRVLVATDGHRLAERKLAATAGGELGAHLIVPARALGELPRAFRGETSDVEVIISKARNQVFFRAGSSEVNSRLIDGTY